MHRVVCLIVGLAFAGSLHADSPPSVADLVKQLGDARFANREIAHRELLKRDEAIVPELDRLAVGGDAETLERLAKIRYSLVGYQDDIKTLLLQKGPFFDQQAMLPELRGLITANQPRSGNFLLKLIADPMDPLYTGGGRAFIQSLDTASAEQVEKFLRLRISLRAYHRDEYPAKCGVLISMETVLRGGWQEWFPEKSTPFSFSTQTTRYLDGKQIGDTAEHTNPFGTVGQFPIDSLAEGRHSINAVMQYEFGHRGVKRKGEYRSEVTYFNVVSAETPDTLLAASSPRLAAKVLEAMIFRDYPRLIDEKVHGMPALPETDTDWRSVTISSPEKGKPVGISCPAWRLLEPLDVDLCFEVVVHDTKTGKSYPAEPITVLRGQTPRGVIVIRDKKAFAQDRDGFVTVAVELKPSRKLALSALDVKGYFPTTIKTEEMRIRVFKSLDQTRDDF